MAETIAGRLAALERKEIETEYKEVTATIKDLTGLLKSPKRMRGVVADELLTVKAAYGDRRRRSRQWTA